MNVHGIRVVIARGQWHVLRVLLGRWIPIVVGVVVTIAVLVMVAALVPSYSAIRVNMRTKVVPGRLVTAVGVAEYGN